jgi:hypothetical protein
MLLLLCLVPPAIVMLLWPGNQPLTVSGMLDDRDRPGGGQSGGKEDALGAGRRMTDR